MSGALIIYLHAVLFIALAIPASGQSSTPSTSQTDQNWSYGAFADGGYLMAANDPPNKLFRSRGTTWHLNDLHLHMSGAYVKKKPTERSRWGTELTIHAGKDDEIFGLSATAPNIAGYVGLRHLGAANVSYPAPAGKGLTMQVGIFSSVIGYDSLYAKDNFNYTRPWGADFTPYLMLGVNASYPFSNRLTGTFFVVNGYWHLANANDVPSSGARLAYEVSPQLTVKETVLVGRISRIRRLNSGDFSRTRLSNDEPIGSRSRSMGIFPLRKSLRPKRFAHGGWRHSCRSAGTFEARGALPSARR